MSDNIYRDRFGVPYHPLLRTSCLSQAIVFTDLIDDGLTTALVSWAVVFADLIDDGFATALGIMGCSNMITLNLYP